MLAYVLNNWRRHRADRYTDAECMPFDFYSSAGSFVGWASSRRLLPEPDLPMSPPCTALLTSEWEWFGLIDPFEIPGPVD